MTEVVKTTRRKRTTKPEVAQEAAPAPTPTPTTGKRVQLPSGLTVVTH